VLVAAPDGKSAKDNIGTAATTSKAASAAKIRILRCGTECVALVANAMTVSATIETARLTR
jgi:glyceraldehyde-3-phosphate dehydrogenase/erythrose-4-phosphate dehydrogenase